VEPGQPAPARDEAAQRAPLDRQLAVAVGEDDRRGAPQARRGDLGAAQLDDADVAAIRVPARDRVPRGGDRRVHVAARLGHQEHGPVGRRGGRRERQKQCYDDRRLDEHMGSRP
jgi:hypothetical protein